MTDNLQALAWILAQDGNKDTQTAYALDGAYVYRREINLLDEVPRAYYFRAPQKEVLADDHAWDEGRVWESCTETGEPTCPTWHVRISFARVAIVSAPDAESAKAKAISRLGLPEGLLRDVHATAMPMPANVR
jgi:hypothetical protein